MDGVGAVGCGDATGAGWLVKLRVADPKPLSGLMDGATYDAKYPAG